MAHGFRQIITAVLGLVLVSTCLLWLNMTRLLHQGSASGKLHRTTPSQDELDQLHEGHRWQQRSLSCPANMLLNNSAKYDKVKHVSNYTRGSFNVYRDKVLILTPVSNSGKKLAHYFTLLCSLSYPHQLISVGLGEDSSTDKTFELATVMARKMSMYFRSVKVFHFNEKMKSVPIYSRHDPDMQLGRRRHLAHARNQLLMWGLLDEQWVLWIDSDVDFVPPDLIQHLLSANSDLTVPSCMYTDQNGRSHVYDKNTWRESNKSTEYLKLKPKDFLMLEGYSLTMRTYLPYLAHEGVAVPIDGVGGCVLLVRADCHRKGLIFPPFVFEHHIETEGMAKMAAAMGFTIKGMPMVNVFHM